MCILCVVQKWSRRVAAMLPWLVLPLIGFWALSQLLPPAFRFEITSPRLACVFVLLVTLFWYEILMPQLSTWRARRNARLRERKRFEAIALQKLRKAATRKCRNCFTPYKDQNPGGGKFMCSYCGHISKRPVLDLPVPPGLGMSNSGIIKDLVGKGGKLLNGKEWVDGGWMCRQDPLDNGNWFDGPSHWKNCENGIRGGNLDCLSDKSYSTALVFSVKLLMSFLTSIMWPLRKIFRLSSSVEDASSSREHRAMLSKSGENGDNYHESRGEKARRKAEEKRQARLEKELLEEEERKQREEVARLVEERRKLRDEILEAEKDRSKSSLPDREKSSKKESEKKRLERRKEKDKSSSKSNSDAEDMEKKTSKESERKRDFGRKNEVDGKEHQRSVLERGKLSGVESGQAVKNTSVSRSNAGTRYLDRMKGTFMSSSRINGSGFFGRAANAPAAVAKENKLNSYVDHVHSSAHRKDILPPECLAGKVNTNADDRNISRPLVTEPQPRAGQKKSWHDLFRGSSSAPVSTSASVISRPNSKLQEEGQRSAFSRQTSSIQSFDNPIDFGSPFSLSTHPNVAASSSLGFSPPIGPTFPRATQVRCEYIPEESEHFEDPCYVPDPISLLGPISESLDNFELDLGMEKPRALKNISTSPEVTKISPIESPFSRLQIAEEKHNGSAWLPSTTKAQDVRTLSGADMHANEKGTWQMWNSSPLGQDLIQGPGSWLSSQDCIVPNKGDVLQSSSQRGVAPLFPKGDHVLPGTHPPQKAFFGNGQDGGACGLGTGSNGNDPWLQSAFYPPVSSSDNHFSFKSLERGAKNKLVDGSCSSAPTNHAFEPPLVHNRSKIEPPVHGLGEGLGKSHVAKPDIGGLFASQNVQSRWSFE